MWGGVKERSRPGIKPRFLILTCRPLQGLVSLFTLTNMLIGHNYSSLFFLSILHCFLFSVLGLDAPFVWGVLPHALFMAGFFLPFRSHLNLTSEKPSLTTQYKEPIVFYFARSHVSTDFLAYCFSFSTRILPLWRQRPWLTCLLLYPQCLVVVPGTSEELSESQLNEWVSEHGKKADRMADNLRVESGEREWWKWD